MILISGKLTPTKPCASLRLYSRISNMQILYEVRKKISRRYLISDPGKVYLDKIKFYCPNFIYTRGPKGVELFTAQTHLHFDVPQIKPVSTIGAGDNFNAGLLYGILRENLSPGKWSDIISSGIDFSLEVCNSYDNYISTEFAAKYRTTH